MFESSSHNIVTRYVYNMHNPTIVEGGTRILDESGKNNKKRKKEK